MTHRVPPGASLERVLAGVRKGHARIEVRRRQRVFSQGELADELYYILKGRVALTVVSRQGKEAVIGMLGPRDFFGEGCLAGQRVRMATATMVTDGTLLRFPRRTVVRLLRTQPAFSERFLSYVLGRNIRIEEDLVDQLFNPSEKRLARILLLLARVGKDPEAERVLPKISQETLAAMVGTTRARVSHFMNKFRKLGLIEYNGGLRVHGALLNVILYD